MKVAVLSDIHGNLEAFEAVCRHLEPKQPDLVVCLGDLVGYGPDPEDIVRRVRESGFQALMGNHEAALASAWDRDRLNFQVKENNIATEGLLTPESLEYCRKLPRARIIAGAFFVHGFPPESVALYLHMVPDAKIARVLAQTTEEIIFVGHTHDLQLIRLEGRQVVRSGLRLGRTELVAGEKYIINAGSVGQPRDGDKRAKYLLWDSATGLVDVFAVEYDVQTTVRKILARGFPAAYASRLR